MSYRSYVTQPPTQREPLNERQVPNNAGGYAFAVDKWTQLDRFLVLGAEGGTYYVTERGLVKENATVVTTCLNEDAVRTVNRIVEIVEAGRAPKPDPAIFALAMAGSHTDGGVRRYALSKLGKVCRIPTHLFHFVEFCKGQRGWGRGLRRAIGEWYLNNPSLAYHLVKYQSRDGWSNRDLLRKAHPKVHGELNYLFRYVVTGERKMDMVLPPIVHAFEEAKTASTARLIELIRQHGLTREMLPTQALTEPEVWEALLDKMPVHALVRNLSTMTRIGLIAPLSQGMQRVVAKLQHLKGVHPLTLLNALKVYSQGRGEQGRSTWTPVPQVVDALNDAFYASFGNVTPMNKPVMLALDISSSMSYARIAGTALTAMEASGALAMITAAVETNYYIGAFAQKFREVKISPRQRLDDILVYLERIGFGGTDCAQPMLHAKFDNIAAEAFLIYTDSETWAGTIHPMAALNIYRQASGLPAKLVVNGMTATHVTIADPADPGSLDVVGFDLATPDLISSFVRGEV